MNTHTTIKLPSDQDASGRRLGVEEKALLAEVIDSGVLIGTTGKQVKELEKEFAAKYQASHAVAVASGTAACHIAYASLGLEPGDEVITTPITDMGAICTLLFQQLVPVFADVDPLTLNVTAQTIEKAITPQTKAIVVTHLFGLPADMTEIMRLANDYDLPVIEDTAQAYLAKENGKLVGTFGTVGCFSFQQGKHMTCGEGGIVITQNAAIARRMKLFRDKGWGFGDPNPDHYSLGLNYRMTELQAAIARAQLIKLDKCVDDRVRLAHKMHSLLKDIPGLILPIPPHNKVNTYWKYPILVDEKIIPGGSEALGAKLKEQGIWCVPRYIKKPAFECQVIRERNTFGKSGYPYNLAGCTSKLIENPKNFSGTYKGLSQVLVLPWNENYKDEHLYYIRDHILESIKGLQVT